MVSFAEYERLYRHRGDPEIRWLMSTVPTAMIFDDHDIRDDWNTSASWRADMKDKPWWRDRIRAGLASYWVYQHLGNLSPAELADDEDYQRLVATDGDTWRHLVDLADRADQEVDCNKGIRFSYRWDLGRSRLIMIDSRNGRILESGERMMIGEREFRWLETQATDGLDELDHLMLASSVPWLMPPAIGDLEAVNERTPTGPGDAGDLPKRPAEQVISTTGRLSTSPSYGWPRRSPASPAIPTDPQPSACCPETCTTATPHAPSGRVILPSRRARRCINWCARRCETMCRCSSNRRSRWVGRVPRLRSPDGGHADAASARFRCPGRTPAVHCSETPSPPCK